MLTFLQELADSVSEDTETKNDITLLVKVNSFRWMAGEKGTEVVAMEKEIRVKQESKGS